MIAPASMQHYRSLLADSLPRLRADYGVASLGVFGSRVRDDNRPDSDLDLLVCFERVPGMMRFVALEQELSDRLGVKVDLVMADSLDAHVRGLVDAEVEPV